MTAPEKKKLKIGAIITAAVLVLGAIAHYFGLFRKSYQFAWTGGQKINKLGDGKYYTGLMLSEKHDFKVGDKVKISSNDAPGINGIKTVMQIGDDMGAYTDTMIVIDVPMGAADATGAADTRGLGTVKRIGF